MNDDNENQSEPNRRKRLKWVFGKNASKPFSLRKELAKFEFWFYLACAAMVALSQLMKCGHT